MLVLTQNPDKYLKKAKDWANKQELYYREVEILTHGIAEYLANEHGFTLDETKADYPK